MLLLLRYMEEMLWQLRTQKVAKQLLELPCIMAGERAPGIQNRTHEFWMSKQANEASTHTRAWQWICEFKLGVRTTLSKLIHLRLRSFYWNIMRFNAITLPVMAERGKSNWGKPFKDEVNSKLLHSGRDVISIANSGLLTNGSQFFIAYKSQNLLNLKHTVFGGVVGGMMMLSAMEKFLVDDDDHPLEEVNITEVAVFVNPSTDPDEEEENENAKEEEAAVD